MVRILSNASYSGVHETAAAVARRLEAFCASGHHVFWTDAVSLRDRRLFKWTPLTHRVLTDVYLLGLAKHKGGRLATFDRHVPLGAVSGAEARHLAVIPA